jgi:hypothetical protein
MAIAISKIKEITRCLSGSEPGGSRKTPLLLVSQTAKNVNEPTPPFSYGSSHDYASQKVKQRFRNESKAVVLRETGLKRRLRRGNAILERFNL